MKFFSGRPRRSAPTPDPVIRHQSRNPMFNAAEPDQTQLKVFRHRVLKVFALTLCVVAIGLVVYGPWLRVTAVEVHGTHALDHDSVARVAANMLDSQRWLIIPNRNLWLLSSHQFSLSIRERISRRLSIEGVDVLKRYPHGLTLTVHERTPTWRWQSGGQLAIVDRQGIVMSLSVPQNSNLPLVDDRGQPVLQIDQAVVKPEVTSSMAQIADHLNQAHLKVSSFLVPAPSCPITLEPSTNPSPATNSNVNLTNNSQDLELVHQTVNSTVNINQSVCDLASLHQSSQEIHVQLEHGPEVYFDRHQNITEAVDALQRVLTDSHTNPKQYIDLRFLPRVYVQ